MQVSDNMNRFNRYFKTFILVALINIQFASCVLDNKPKLVNFDDQEATMLFKHLDPITEKYDLPKLRDFSRFGDNFEVRVWVTVLGGTDGIILRRYNYEWSAVAIKEIDCGGKSGFYNGKRYQLGNVNLNEPESGWRDAWGKLVESGILDLPSMFEISDYEGKYLHGIVYVVEINKGGEYRIYQYANPQAQTFIEAQKMIKIGEIIGDEFGLHNFKIGSGCR